MTWLVDIMKQFNIWVLNTSLRLKKILNLAHFITTIFPKVSSALVNTVWTDFIQDWIPKAFIKGYFSSWGFHYSLQFESEWRLDPRHTIDSLALLGVSLTCEHHLSSCSAGAPGIPSL